jgi:CheY-like chemotaxis protein
MPSQDRSVVLLVEDEPLVRLVTAELLAESGLRVIEAVNAAEALAVLESGLRVEVVLSDIEMPPGPDGFALARQIRKCWPKVEVLLTSGRQWPREGDLPPGVASSPSRARRRSSSSTSLRRRIGPAPRRPRRVPRRSCRSRNRPETPVLPDVGPSAVPCVTATSVRCWAGQARACRPSVAKTSSLAGRAARPGVRRSRGRHRPGLEFAPFL